ncbi:MAG: OmpR family two-component response regulator [Gemmatimonadetes bacterium]|nr:OmpR family two-component response regulator [Gemmatimonadota bacterium]
MRVFIVEDDEQLSAAVARGLRDQGIETNGARTLDAAREGILFAMHDVIVLDVVLADGSGFDLCAMLRSRGITTPVLMLTARDAVADRIRGLEAGADDYLTKPFAFGELVARLRALARRGPALVPEVVRVADLDVDLGSRRARRAGRPIVLTAKEFALLEVFIRHENVVLDRATITARVWDENHDPAGNTLEALVRRLRAKIDDGFAPRLIHTVRGAGYRFSPLA